MFDVTETIVAPASARGPALRGIVRISGDRAVELLAAQVAEPSRVALQSATTARAIDCQLRLDGWIRECPCTIYLWPDARSYTRQPTAEIHLPGAPPLVDAVVRCLCQQGARLAKPGEFTLRAFLAGRIDLPKAEAVLGVIDAQSDIELQRALRQLAGGLSDALNQIRDQLLNLAAELEAGLDFAEEDIQFIVPEQADRELATCHTAIQDLLHRMQARATAASIHRVVFVGPPNAGKSTLVNALVGRQAAIVSDQAGTTRDYVTSEVEIAGLHCLLVDTAGIDESDVGHPKPDFDLEAQRVGDAQGREAHLIVDCLDRVGPAAERQDFNEPIPRLHVATKADLSADRPLRTDEVCVSAHTGQGLELLRNAIVSKLVGDSTPSEVVASTIARCQTSLQSTLDCIGRARGLNSASSGDELVACEVRLALDHLGQIVGAIYTDDLLDRVFSRFCIGK